MNLPLDSHAVLWFLWDGPLLSTTAKNLIVDPANRKLASVASCWEIAIKVSTGKLRLGEPARSFLGREIVRNNFDLLPITLDHPTAVEALPFYHRDPFDRLLVAQGANGTVSDHQCRFRLRPLRRNPVVVILCVADYIARWAKTSGPGFWLLKSLYEGSPPLAVAAGRRYHQGNGRRPVLFTLF
jgi:PIN domain nuclease of toxin-antitoxin system